jgi:hypothetical protein
MNDTVAAIVSAFFLIGILVGIIAVIAMSVLRAERRRYPGDPLDFKPRGSGEPLPGLPWDDTAPDGRTGWPEDVDNDFSGR